MWLCKYRVTTYVYNNYGFTKIWNLRHILAIRYFISIVTIVHGQHNHCETSIKNSLKKYYYYYVQW